MNVTLEEVSATALRHEKRRPLIAFFDYPDVFEDFYVHYGIDQRTFATSWANTGSHAFVSLLQEQVGNVIWYTSSICPEIGITYHEEVGCRVKVLSSSWLHRQLWRWFYLSKNAWRWRRLYPIYAWVSSYLALPSMDFFRSLRKDRPDFIFVQDYATGRYDVLLMVARLFRIPLVAYHTGSAPERYVGKLAKRWTIPRAELLIASSSVESTMLLNRFRASPSRVTVILTPIRTDIYTPMSRPVACQAAGLLADRRYLLFVGRLDDRIKRVSSIIRSFAEVAERFRDTDLLVAGEGGSGTQLRELANKLAPGRVRFLGWIGDMQRKTEIYNMAECLVLASRSEGFPTVVGEAMACGTPVLATDVGGVREMVVEDETGWLIPAKEIKQLTLRLAEILSNQTRTAQFRPRARQMAEKRVSPAAVGKALKECFSGLANASKKHPSDHRIQPN